MASYYKRLKSDLDSAAAAGIITPEQSDKLYTHIHSGSFSGSFKASTWIAVISGVMITAGVSLIIAHNWDKIDAAAKVFSFLLVMAGVALAAISFEEKPAVAVPSEVLWFFMPIIGIGLYAQVFNLSGDPVRPYLAWLALSLPLAALSPRKTPAIIAIMLAFAIMYCGNFSPGNMITLISRYEGAASPRLWHWAWPAVLAGAAFLLYFFKLKAAAGRYRLTGLSLGWLMMVFLSPTALQVRSPVFITLTAVSLAVIWLLLSQDEGAETTQLPLYAWTAVVYGMTFFWHYNPGAINYKDDTMTGMAAAWVVFAAALLLIAARPIKFFSSDKRLQAGARIALAVSITSAFLLFDASDIGAKAIAVMANALLMLTGLACIMDGSQNSNEKEINRGAALIFLIIATRFVDFFGSLVRSGLAFIAVGLFFAALAWGLNKGRKAIIDRLTTRTEELKT
ncbi:MAG: DUF2157 domain-containing protein [Elusimicrobia bacterium]|nr:DUF2157 domain-containing protein [Elusimicrobiota bacterium]